VNVLVWFRSLVWLGENQNCGGTGSFQLGIGQFPPFWPIHLWYYMESGSFPKIARAKNSGGAAGGGAAQNANSDEAKPRSEAAKRSSEAASEELTQCVNNF